MPNHYEYALMSAQAYEENPTVAGWKMIDHRNNAAEFGFAAVAFQREKNKEIVIAFRGTVPTEPQNLLTDILLVLDSANKPYNCRFADDFIKKITDKHPNYKLSFTGHSLGAIYAEIAACQHKKTTVTFESPGSKEIVDNNPDCSGYDNENIVCYLTAPNAINTCKPHIGKLYRLSVPHVDGLSVWHAVECALGSIGRISNYLTTFFKPVTTVVLQSTRYVPRSLPNGVTLQNAQQVTAGTLRIIRQGERVVPLATNVTRIYTAARISEMSVLSVSRLGMQVVSDTKWLLRQHSITNIIESFLDKNKIVWERPVFCQKILAWPALRAESIGNSITKFFKEQILLFQPDQKGLHTLDEHKLIEAQIAKMEGYRVETHQYNNCKHEQNAITTTTYTSSTKKRVREENDVSDDNLTSKFAKFS